MAKEKQEPIIWTTKEMPVESLKPAEYNPRKISDVSFEALKKSLTSFGHAYPVIINQDLTVIGGHQTLRAAKELGWVNISVSVPSRALDKDKEKALNLALNKIDGQFDDFKLREILADLDRDNFKMDVTGFTQKEVDALIGGNEEKNLDEFLEEYKISGMSKPFFLVASVDARFRSKIIPFAEELKKIEGCHVELSYDDKETPKPKK